ncbi:hypothetical protein [Pseudomonas sp. NMI760_13]|uniref:hypothetical protein n=1 Tax=Pseudomonas sp. NMI760_13 TaxID=2903147 RepID=UPI001E4F9948|nr:hypothetical protein [Pseudomonas sp. NMI760_13]MCE0917619.1 hypothetical protein [Pseudomonas sp. NMI760_13]
MITYKLKLVITSHDQPAQVHSTVSETLGKSCTQLKVRIRRISTEAMEIEIEGERTPLDAAHMKLSQTFAKLYPFVRVLDELGDALRSEAYPLLGHLEQELRGFINEAMVYSGIGIDWLAKVGNAQITARVMATQQKGQGAIYQHPVEFTELDHLLEIVTVDLAAWDIDRPVSASDMFTLLQEAKDLEEVRATLAQRMQKRSFWDVVFSSFFDDMTSWRNWKSRWKKEVITLRNRVMHHRPVFAWEIEKLRQTAHEFTNLLKSHRKQFSITEEESVREAAQQLMDTFQSRSDLHLALGGSKQSGISVSSSSNSIFLFVSKEPTIVNYFKADSTHEVVIRYEGEGQSGDQRMTRGNLAIYEHAKNGRQIHIFGWQKKSREFYYIGQAEYRNHYTYTRENGHQGIMFELNLTPSSKFSEKLESS